MARPRKQPQPQPQPEQAEPETTAAGLETFTEPVEVELPDEPLEAAPSATNGADVAPPEPVVQPPPPAPEPPQDDLRKRLSDMEAAQNALQARNAELERQAREAQSQAARFKQDAAQDRYDGLMNAIGAAQSELETAKRDLKLKGSDGDWEGIAEAQERIGRFSAQLQGLEGVKNQFDAERERVPQQQQPQPQIQDPVEASIAASAIPDRAKNWLRSHREYMTSPEKNAALQYFHHQAVRETGEFTDGYFNRMEELLGLRQRPPEQVVAAPNQTSSFRNVQAPVHVSAPVTREVPSMSTGQAQPKRVTLNAEEREIAAGIAQSRNITQQEAEREYAKQKLRFEDLKRQGHYTIR